MFVVIMAFNDADKAGKVSAHVWAGGLLLEDVPAVPGSLFRLPAHPEKEL